MRKKKFPKFFLKSPVSRIVPKNVKRGGRTLRFFEHPFFCKIEKIEIKKNAKKKFHKAQITCSKNFGQGRDSNPRPSAWQTSKNPNYPLCTTYISVAVKGSQRIKSRHFVGL